MSRPMIPVDFYILMDRISNDDPLVNPDNYEDILKQACRLWRSFREEQQRGELFKCLDHDVIKP